MEVFASIFLEMVQFRPLPPMTTSRAGFDEGLFTLPLLGQNLSISQEQPLCDISNTSPATNKACMGMPPSSTTKAPQTRLLTGMR